MKICMTIGLMLVGGVASAQDASEIYLFDVGRTGDRLTISGGKNISRHPGYDNQPCFHPSQPVIYYSSFNEQGRSDIKTFNYKTGKTTSFTTTSEREYSPTVTPDEKSVSCIIQRDNDAQDLGIYPIDGGPATTLIDNLVVGYHAWINSDQLMLFVLGDPMTLQLFNLKTGKNRIIAENIGRSLHRIPGEQAMSFVDKPADQPWLIKRLDIETGKITDIVATIPGKEDLAWTPNGKILMSDGNQILIFDPSFRDQKWQVLVMEKSDLSGITRLAMSRDGKHLAVVASE